MRALRVHVLIGVALAGLMGLAWVGQVSPPGRLDQIRQRGELIVGTRIGPSMYYETEDGFEGLEYDLAKGFAKQLGVELRMRPITSLEELATELDSGRIDLVAAGIGPSRDRIQRFAFTEPYMQVHPQLVYRNGNIRPKDLSDAVGDRLEVIAGSAHEELLRGKLDAFPKLSWRAVDDRTGEDLLYRLWSGRSDYVVTDSNKLAINQHFYPELRAAFDVGEPRGLSWMLRPGDDELLDAANRYFIDLRESKQLANLRERYYGHLDRFDYVGTRVFMRHTTERLPQYRELFEHVARKNALDWRLLAAQGYQESHWDADAVSPTGVRGVMMLTRGTARQVGVENRSNAEQSIRGGARYLRSMHDRLPDSIPEPERSWFALAAYNVGLGHVRDARDITRQQQADPNSWTDVKKRLPLLGQKKWYQQTKYGFARGWEPVRYVENIRKYYQLLVRVTEPALLRRAAEEHTDPEDLIEDPGGWRLTDEAESAL